jgi:hypothetical protein
VSRYGAARRTYAAIRVTSYHTSEAPAFIALILIFSGHARSRKYFAAAARRC